MMSAAEAGTISSHTGASFPETADIETASEAYAARFAGPTGAWLLAVQERMTLDGLARCEVRTVLDVGGGHGQLAPPLARAGYDVTVIGSAPSCRQRVAPLVEAGQCRFVVGDLTALPFPDRSFDAVVCVRFLAHCERWPHALGELCRVARVTVILDYPTSQSLNRIAPRLFGAKKKLEGNTRPFRLFRHAEIADVCGRHGFAMRHRAGQFLWPMVLHRALRCRPLSAAAERVCASLGLTRRWGSPVIAQFVRRAAPVWASAPAPGAIPPGTPVLVTGATGFTGAVLTRKLVQAGLDVRAIARASSRLDALADLNIRWFRGDVFDAAVADAAADGVAYIFHTAAAYREAKYGDAMYAQVHVRSTQLLAQAAARNPRFQRFVHVSTVGVLGHIEQPPADETSPLQPGDIYQRTKAEAELWLRAFGRERGLPYTVIRPAAIYGPGDTRLLKFFKMAARRYLVLLGRGRCLYHLIHVDDLTNVLILAATHPAALNEVFICGAPDWISLEEIGRIVGRVLGREPRVVRLPAAPFFLVADVCEWICRRLGVEPPIHRRRLAFFTKDRAFDTRKLRERLGYTPRHTNEEGIRDTARWYVEQGWL